MGGKCTFKPERNHERRRRCASNLNAPMWKPKPATNPEILYGAREIAAYLRIGRRTVWRWRDQHGLPCSLTPGGMMMLPKRAVEAWNLSRYRQQMKERQNGAHPG